ncbi:hypothetical protein EMCRGX_G022297 [Ephydatia muelleri]
MKRVTAAAQKKTPYKCSVEPYDWFIHSLERCKGCNGHKPFYTARWQKTGKLGSTPAEIVEHIRAVMPHRIIQSPTHPSLAPIQLLSAIEELQCPICFDVLQQPIQLLCDSQVSKQEMQLVSKVVHSMLDASKENCIRIPIGGTPLTLARVTAPKAPVSDLSVRTRKRRVQELQKTRKILSAGPMDSDILLQDEIRALTKEEKQQLLHDAGITVDVQPIHELAMKSMLGILWYRLRILRRWLKQSGVCLGSERKQRALCKELIGDNLEVELALFSFKLPNGEEGLRGAAYGYTPNLTSKIVQLLEQNENYEPACALDRFRSELGGPYQQNEVETLKDLDSALIELEQLNQEAESVQQLATYNAIVAGAVTPIVDELLELAGNCYKRVQVQMGFNLEEGPCIKGIESCLTSFGVCRQRYYGGIFVGNHVHKILKPANVDTLCSCVLKATENVPELKLEAVAVHQKFRTILMQFSECHVLYDSTVLTQDDIQHLGQAIKNFFCSFDRDFKGIARTLKMHILEDHMLEWLSMHQAGCGLMGEQGAESIHAKFNSSLRTYSGIKDPVAKLKCILQDHYLSISPHMTSAVPPPKKHM